MRTRCWVAMVASAAMVLTVTPYSTARTAADRSAERPRPAALSAQYSVNADHSVTVNVASNARRVRVRFLTGKQHRRVLARRVHGGAVNLMLKRGSHAIKVRTVPTRRLATSGWVQAKRQQADGTPTPNEVSTPPTTTSPPASPSTPTASDPPATPPSSPPASDPPATPPSSPPASDPPSAPPSSPPATTPPDAPALLTAAANRRVLFGHQSVGWNILDAVPGVYAGNGLTAPPIVAAPAGSLAGGYLSEFAVGSNGDPDGKVDDFDAVVRGGPGSVDVALMKFCFVDVTSGTDVDALFTHYRTTMTALEHDYPAITFVYVTAPLTTDSPADNVARERLNQLIRSQYSATGRLFDLAAVESTRPDGSRVGGTSGGEQYYALHPAYASDEGHLNETGAGRAATALMTLLGGLG